MRQVPKDNAVALLGSGRLARHLSAYFSSLEIDLVSWSRDGDSQFNSFDDTDAAIRLRKVLSRCHRVILLVSDDAIAELIDRIQNLIPSFGGQLFHCSGVTVDDRAICLHPLMTFSGHVYPDERYQSIPFVLDTGHDLKHYFPELPNPAHTIAPDQRPLYHSLCVMSGNFSQLMWSMCSNRLNRSLGLPPDVLFNYLKQNLHNYLADPSSALTGPLVRGDGNTLDKHIDALEGDPLGRIYDAFVSAWKQGLDSNSHDTTEKTA